MARQWGFACVFVVGFALLIACGETAPPSAPAPKHSGNLPTQELAGCSARGCHGASLSDATVNDFGAWDYGAKSANAATVWLRLDKHAHAYELLREEKAVQIMRLLDHVPDNESPKDAWKELRCLACHATPAHAAELAGADSFQVDGFSCEACHGGPASRYLTAHQTKDFPGKDVRESYRQIGLTWLNDPASRSQLCVGCHVGAPEDKQNGLPLRDMNHDMIAAGHPRLTFEFASYLRNMPPHWQERNRTKPGAPLVTHSPLADWLAGQQAVADAGLKLLAARAKAAASERANPPTDWNWRTGAPWPEFAEYDCYACHRSLAGRSGPEAGLFLCQGDPPGVVVWNRWCWSLPFRELMAKGGVNPAGVHDKLCKELARPVPSPAKVQEYVHSARTLLGNLSPKAADVLAGIRPPADKDGTVGPLRWDEAAQLYHAWAAAYVSAPTALKEAELRLQTVRDQIRFKIADRQNSPADYVPTAFPASLRTIFKAP